MKKVYYVPGMISAILLPLLFWYYGHQKYQEINVSIIDIGLPAKIKEGEKSYYLSFESYRNWNYKKIKVNPNTAKKNSELYISEIIALQKRNEKETGIEFLLDNKNTYGDLVSLLNDTEISNQPAYCLDIGKTGHFFVPYEYINSNKQYSYLSKM